MNVGLNQDPEESLDDIKTDQQKLEKLENEILQSYERWEELEELA